MPDDNITMTVDLTQFNAALNQYIPKVKHSLAYILNKKAYYIALRAYKATPVAVRTDIQNALNVTQTESQRKSKKTGMMKTIRKTDYSAILKQKSYPKIQTGAAQFIKPNLAPYQMSPPRKMNNPYAILQWWKQAVKKQGAFTPFVPASEIKKFIAHRLGAVGTLARGWRQIIAVYAGIVNESFSVISGSRVKFKGEAKPATDGWNPVASMTYQVNLRKSGQDAGIDGRVISALQIAFDAEAADMVQFVASQLQPDMSAISATKSTSA